MVRAAAHLHALPDQMLKNVEISRDSGIGGIKLKVGQPDLPIMTLGEFRQRKLAPHFAKEIHLCTWPTISQPWLEHVVQRAAITMPPYSDSPAPITRVPVQGSPRAARLKPSTTWLTGSAHR